MQLLSFTTGERFHNGGFVLLTNLFKYEHLRPEIYRLLKRNIPENFEEYLVLIFAAHEFAHRFHCPVPLFNELTADIPMLWCCLEILKSGQLPGLNATDYIAAVLIEYAGQLIAPDGGGIYEKGYHLSSEVLLGLLRQYSIWDSSNGDLSLDTEKIVAELPPKLLNLRYWLRTQTGASLEAYQKEKSIIWLAQDIIDKHLTF